MSHPNPLYPARRRRGRHGVPRGSRHSPLARLATAAAVAYGAYRLGAWAWEAYVGEGGKDDDESVEDDDDDCDSWAGGDRRRAVEREIRKEEGFSSVDGEESSAMVSSSADRRMKRSRRSRVDWDDGHQRSQSPSPPLGYRHHGMASEGGETKGFENAKLSAGGALAMAGGAVASGIAAGIEAYGRSGQPDAMNNERQLRMERCRLEASRAMMDFLPTLKNAVAKETDVSQEMVRLKQLRMRKREIFEAENGHAEANGTAGDEFGNEEDAIREEERCLWNEIKEKSFPRLLTTAYAHTIVFLMLTAQVNLLGGRLMREEREEDQSSEVAETDRYRASHQAVLSNTYVYLFAKGIPSLAASLRRIAKGILSDWDVLGEDVSRNDVSTWIERARIEVERSSVKGGISPFAGFVIPPEGEASMGADDGVTDELAAHILDETYDLLESPTYAAAERRCLDATFAQLRTRVIDGLFPVEGESRAPLARVVVHLQKAAVNTFHEPPSHGEEMKSWGGILGMMEEPLPSAPNEYIPKLEHLDAVLELGDVCF
ncbi:hypothetical protein ACHAWF_001584 [Thalassiosira exigua]